VIALADRFCTVSLIANIGAILNSGDKYLSRVTTVRRCIIKEERRPNMWF
jgi:hypothetical protein